jgi:molybdopterin converting factor small subunit
LERKAAPAAAVPVRCVVELMGVARLLAKTREVTLDLPPAATLGDVYAGLADEHPVLLGRVLQSEGGLTRGYACNINGVEFVRDMTAKIKAGDRIYIISADAGG